MEILDLAAALGLLAEPTQGRDRDADPEAQRASNRASDLLGVHTQVRTKGVDCFLGCGHDRRSLMFGPAHVNGQFRGPKLRVEHDGRWVAKTAAVP